MTDGTPKRNNPAALRRRVFLLFAVIALGTSAVIAGSLWYAAAKGGTEAVALAGALSIAAVAGLCLWVWLRVDERGVQPVAGVARALETLAHSGAAGGLDRIDASALGSLGPAAVEVAEALNRARADLDEAKAEAAARAAAQMSELETILRDLDEAVIVSTRAHRILLCNRRAVDLLAGAGEIGLGRRLTDVLSRAPLDHAVERLERAASRGEPLASTSAVCTAGEGERMIHVRIALLPGDRGDTRGYVATIRDVTIEVSVQTERDRLLARAIDAARRASANISVAIDVGRQGRDMDPDDRRALADSIAAEAAQLGQRAASLDAARERLATITWPMDDVTTTDLFESVGRRSGVAVTIAGGEQWVRCDSLSIAALLSRLCLGLARDHGARNIALGATEEEGRGYVELLWQGEVASMRQIEDWLSGSLDDAPGRPTGREVLDHHGSDLWPDRSPEGEARLRLPLDIVAEGAPRPRIPARPEFYDFDLTDQPLTGDLSGRSLSDLVYVVFDSETTGLEPAKDNLVQVAGVRIVNGRVLGGERFDRLCDPGRPIPPASTRIHGITDQMVEGAEPPGDVVRHFAGFTTDAVLVAHNAAFDMAFLRRAGGETLFEANPVLDTVLLSAWAYDHTGAHTLDDLAERLDVDIASEVRHTAIGDALATAQVFVKLLPVLEARGIRTLGDALAASGEMHRIRAMQADYG